MVYLFVGLLFAVPCSTETDEFTGETAIKCDPVEVVVEEQPGERVFLAKGYAMRSGGSIIVGVMSYSDSWNFLRVDEVHALIDGERATFAAFREGETVSRSVGEQVAMKVPARQARSMVRASSIRVKIEEAVFDVSVLSSQVEYVLNH